MARAVSFRRVLKDALEGPGSGALPGPGGLTELILGEEAWFLSEALAASKDGAHVERLARSGGRAMPVVVLPDDIMHLDGCQRERALLYSDLQVDPLSSNWGGEMAALASALLCPTHWEEVRLKAYFLGVSHE